MWGRKNQMRSALGLVLFLLDPMGQANEFQVTSRSLWQPTQEALQSILDATHQRLNQGSCEDIRVCFLDELKSRNLLPEVIRFIDLTQDSGYMDELKEIGSISMAHLTFPFRANQNEALVLVNGKPAYLDIDSSDFLDQSGITEKLIYQKLLKSYPGLSIFPRDRSSVSALKIRKKNEGATEVIAGYSIRECRACPERASFDLSFLVNAQGELVTVKIHSFKKL